MLPATCRLSTNTAAMRAVAARKPVCMRAVSVIAMCCTNRLPRNSNARMTSTIQSRRVRSASSSVKRAMVEDFAHGAWDAPRRHRALRIDSPNPHGHDIARLRLALLLSLRQQDWLALMLLGLHVALVFGIDSALSKAFLLFHFGCFLLWQPVWRGEQKVYVGQALLIVGAAALLVASRTAGG